MRSPSTARPGETMSERPSPSSRNAYKALRTITTRWMDNDIYGHMNNVVHYSLFDTAVNGWLIGEGVPDIHGGDQVGLSSKLGAAISPNLLSPTRVTAGVRVAKFGTSSLRYEVGLFRNEEETAVAEGFFVHVYVDRETRRPKALNHRRGPLCRPLRLRRSGSALREINGTQLGSQ